MRFSCKTKGDVSPNGKKPVFVHAVNEDSELRDKIAGMIFILQDGHTYAVWYAEGAEQLCDNRKELEYLGAAVFIPIVTENYLSWCKQIGKKKLCDFFDALTLKGTAILPVFNKPENIIAFNKLVGDWHGIPLDSKLTQSLFQDQIKRFIPDDAFYETVEERAFNGKIFLSYRKVDRDEALDVMKAIHNTRSASAVAIWFDDFLIAGRDFNDQIMEQLKNCDAMALVVTPNLYVDEDNYVCREEYPTAHEKLGKDVLPVEATDTDRKKLESLYDGIKNISDINNAEDMERLMRQASFEPPATDRDRDYLLGMAFYLGIHVEKDMERALKLIGSSADHGNADAAEQMAFFYMAGIGVKRDLDKAVEYKIKAEKILSSEIKNEPVNAIKRIYKLLYGTDGLCLLLKARGKSVKARSYDRDFLSYLNRVSPSKIDECDLYRAQAYSDLADVFYDDYPSSNRINDVIEFANKGMEIIKQSEIKYCDEMQFVMAQLLAGLADCFKAQGKPDKAEEYYKEASNIAIKIYRSANDLDYLSLYVSVNINLGMLLREKGNAYMMSHPMESVSAMQPARSYFGNAEVKARELVAVNPTMNHRESLAIALLDLALVTPEKKAAVGYLEEALKIAKELTEETGDDSFIPLRNEIASVLKKRKGSVFRKIVGFLIVVFIILVILKITGIVDFEPLLKNLFGIQ